MSLSISFEIMTYDFSVSVFVFVWTSLSSFYGTISLDWLNSCSCSLAIIIWDHSTSLKSAMNEPVLRSHHIKLFENVCVWNQHINTNTPPTSTSTSTAHNNHSHWRHTRRVVCLNDGHTLKRSLCIKVAILHYKPYSVTVHHIIFPCFLAAHAHVWLTDSSRIDLVQLDATRSDFILHKIGEIGKGMNEHVFVFVCVCVFKC